MKKKKAQIKNKNVINLPYNESNEQSIKVLNNKIVPCEAVNALSSNKSRMLYYDNALREAFFHWRDQPAWFAEYEPSFQVFKEAAEFGHPVGQFYYAICLLYGYGCEKSKEKAIEWFTKARANNIEQADYYLRKLIQSSTENSSCEMF